MLTKTTVIQLLGATNEKKGRIVLSVVAFQLVCFKQNYFLAKIEGRKHLTKRYRLISAKMAQEGQSETRNRDMLE